MSDVNDRADQAHARYSSARAELLEAVAEIASQETWHGDGARDLATWLAARWQIARRTARDLMRNVT